MLQANRGAHLKSRDKPCVATRPGAKAKNGLTNNSGILRSYRKLGNTPHEVVHPRPSADEIGVIYNASRSFFQTIQINTDN